MTDAQRAAQRRYTASEKGREAQRRAHARYRRTDHGALAQAACRRRRRALVLAAVGTHTVQQWRVKLASFAGSCHWCGKTAPLTKDHLIPLSRGGTNLLDNVVPACRSCNASKRDRLPAEWRSTHTHTHTAEDEL